MKTKKSNIEKARFDTRLSREQKALFERAARLGGYRSLTDFVVLTVQKRAKEIIQENDQILASPKYGFIMLPDSGKMFLPKKTIKNLFV